MREPVERYSSFTRLLPPATGINARAIAATPVTNRVAVAILNALPPYANGDTQGGYRYINTHNPAQPIRYDAETGTYHTTPEWNDHPVVGITWSGAAFFADRLGGRLPTVTEWEYAATSGGATTFPWGDEPPAERHANFAEYVGATTPVGAYEPTAWGLYDMAGNVGEWCTPAPGHTWDRTTEYPVKGGAWNKPATQLHPRHTRHKWGRIGTVGIGFRVVYDI